MRNIFRLALAILICQAAGVLGSLFTFQAISGWYQALAKPFFTPPNWAFGPVWLTLYTLMGVSLYLVWTAGLHKKEVRTAVWVFGAQLFLNAIWAPIFFGAQQVLLAFVVIAALWAAILATIFAFYRISKTAAYLLVPYIAWVTVAAALNYSVWVLN